MLFLDVFTIQCKNCGQTVRGEGFGIRKTKATKCSTSCKQLKLCTRVNHKPDVSLSEQQSQTAGGDT